MVSWNEMQKSSLFLLLITALLTGCASAIPALSTTAAAKELYEQAVRKNAPIIVPATAANSPAHPFCLSEAHADGVTAANAESLCSSSQTLAPAACLHQAGSNGFNSTQSVSLCTGATSDAPASCAKEAILFGYNSEEATSLCAKANDHAPAQCARQATVNFFDHQQALQLCSGAFSEQPVFCARDAKMGGKTIADAVTQCKSSNM
jgi:hypothetical protein